MTDLNITTNRIQDNITCLKLSGFLDAHTYEQLDERIESLFDQDHYRLIFELSELEYISSAGAGVFIGALGKAQDHQGDIILVSPSENVQEVFNLLGFQQIFSFSDSVNTAAKQFTNNGE